MKTDLYTKAVLTAVAVSLTLTACDKFIHPVKAVAAQAGHKASLFAVGPGGEMFFTQDGSTTVSIYRNDGVMLRTITLH